ncbi:MAG: Ig-like domain-containing protein, partial [Vicinamibacterales bacterium]
TAGSTTFANQTFSVTGAGADVWGTADAFQYVYRTLDGDGSIVARVSAVQNVASWTKAGVMMRSSLNPGSAQGFMLVSWAKGIAFQRRLANGAASISTAGIPTTAPRWVKLTRSGNTITAFESATGSTWTLVASDTFAMGPSIDVGLAVSSHVTGTNATATFDNVVVTPSGTPPPPPPVNAAPSVALTSPSAGATAVAPAAFTVAATAADSDGSIARVEFYTGSTSLGQATTAPYSIAWSNVAAGTYIVTAVAVDNLGSATTSSPVSITVTAPPPPPTGLPAGWSSADIGTVPFAGSATMSGGTFTVTGAGADVWGTADQLHYAYRSWTGDGTLIARVASEQNVSTWVKAGVMIRQTLAAGSPHAFMLVSPAKGTAFQRRSASGGTSASTSGPMAAAPRWLKLTRSGDSFTAYDSADGVAWTLVGTDTIPMSTTVLVGLAVTSHNVGATATATFDNVTVR